MSPQGQDCAWAEQELSLQLHAMLSSATVPSLKGPNTLPVAVSCVLCPVSSVVTWPPSSHDPHPSGQAKVWSLDWQGEPTAACLKGRAYPNPLNQNRAFRTIPGGCTTAGCSSRQHAALWSSGGAGALPCQPRARRAGKKLLKGRGFRLMSSTGQVRRCYSHIRD